MFILDEIMHLIELSTDAVKAIDKLLGHLTESDLYDAGFSDGDVDSFGELFHGVTEVIETLEIESEA